MLFYIKRHLWLEIIVTVLLAGIGHLFIRRLNLPFVVTPSARAVGLGVAGWMWLVLWTLAVQQVYRVVRGRHFADELTGSLAKEFANPTLTQVVFGGLTACAEEIFFRGFLQQELGLLIASVLFMIAHFGRRDIRVVSYWSIFQGLYLGLFFQYSGNLLVPMIAHGFFDIGGMVYFRRFMEHREKHA